MPNRQGSRFALEALFLIALAGGLAFADLRPLVIAAIMLAGWVVVAALEWAAWRDEPHYGAGLPPRYYVPRVSLPPPQPLESVAVGYPEARRDEAPTWIASPALRDEIVGAWPIATPAGRNEQVDAEREERDVEPVRLPPAPEVERERAVAAHAVPSVQPEPELEPEPDAEPEPVSEREPEPVGVVALPRHDGADDGVVETDAQPRLQPVAGVEREETVEREEVEREQTIVRLETQAEEPEATAAADEPEATAAADEPEAKPTLALHHIDPFEEPVQRRFRRRAELSSFVVEVPARPSQGRPLPLGVGREG